MLLARKKEAKVEEFILASVLPAQTALQTDKQVRIVFKFFYDPK